MKIIKKIFITIAIFTLVLCGFLINKRDAVAQVPSMSNVKHVFIIVMENHDATALSPASAPYLNSLYSIGSHALNYHNVPTSIGFLHPSEPNYVWLEGGTNKYSDFTFTNDNNASVSNSTATTNHLSTLLDAAGYSWKSYQESMPAGVCPINSSGSYAAKHDPFVFFRDVSGNPPSTSNSYCISHHSVLTAAGLQNDLNSGNVANYNFLTPNLCNDMHDCSVATGDNWLKTFIPVIMNSNVYKQDGAIFITFDEGGSGNNPIGMTILSPFAKANYTNNVEYSHASFVKSVEHIFNLNPLVGHAADSTVLDLADFFGQNNQPQTTPVATPSSINKPTPFPHVLPSPTPTPINTSTPVSTQVPQPCPVISTALGAETMTINTPISGAYRVWSRIMAAGSSDSYFLQVDNNCPILVGNGGISPNIWQWVNYQNGNTNNIINLNLAQGTHVLKLIGSEPGAKLDRVIVTDSFTCIPALLGDNCAIETIAHTPSPTSIGGQGVPPTPSSTQIPSGTSTGSNTFRAVADATVDKTNPTKNYGKANTLGVSPTKISYLRFSMAKSEDKEGRNRQSDDDDDKVSEHSRKIKSAKIRLVVAAGSIDSVTIASISDSDWSESKVTYNNRPKFGDGKTVKITKASQGDTIEVDVTSLVQKYQGKKFTLVLYSNSTGQVAIYSDENPTGKPQLIVN